MAYGQIRTSSGRTLDLSPQGWVNNEGQNLNSAPMPGRLSQLAQPMPMQQGQEADGPMNDQTLAALVQQWSGQAPAQQTQPQPQDLDAFLAANNTSGRNVVDYYGKKAFLTPEGAVIWQNPDGSTGKMKIRNREQEAFETAQRAAEKEKLNIDLQRAALAKGPTVTPHLSEVVDPQDQARMLRVDVNSYRGGGLGSPGVIGISGKEPGAEKVRQKADVVAEKKALGKQEFSDELDNVQGLYDRLNELKALPSTGRSTLSNLASSVQASGAGQLAGKAIGSDEQRIRDEIASARMRLLQAVKNATGMSAQQMNSNIELQTMLNSLGDASKTYEANTGIIEQMRNRYGGNANAATPGAAKPVAPSSTDHQQTLFNAKKAIAKNPAAREAIIQKMQAAGYDTKGL